MVVSPNVLTNSSTRANCNKPKKLSKMDSANSPKVLPSAKKDFISTSWQANPN
jgi:hypothetical protein